MKDNSSIIYYGMDEIDNQAVESLKKYKNNK